MGEVAIWLRSLGLGQYAEAFADNDIGWAMLPELNHDLLKEIGVASVGHRIALLKAVAAIGDDVGPNQRPERRPSIRQEDAQRRQLTVMFCDLVGSTALSQQLDSEDLRELIRAYQDAAKAAIERFDGFVARYMGDGILAYFGYPRAHEDAAERAVRAGLGLLAAIESVNHGIGREKKVVLALRVGLATGPVIVGDIIGEGASQESAVVGETPNVAARLQALADPGTIVLGETTRRLIGANFEVEALGKKSLKGITGLVAVYRVAREARVDSRFAATRRHSLSPLIARNSELDLLSDLWEQTKSGSGRAALISGEAGIGKSRIVEAMRERLGGEAHHRLHFQCSAHYTNTAFYPFAAQLRGAAGIEQDDPASQRLLKLESLLRERLVDFEKVFALFASMLSLPVNGYPTAELTPRQHKEATIRALAAHVVTMSSSRPVLLLFEDAHWADPTSLVVLDEVFKTFTHTAILAIITHRPEFVPPWGEPNDIAAIRLGRLDHDQAVALVARLARGRTLPAGCQEDIVNRADGIPLYLEELTAAVLESAPARSDLEPRYSRAPELGLKIPPTLQDSLLARLDRAAGAKELAQTAACIGREFSYEIIAEVSSLSESDLNEALCELVASDLLLSQGTPPRATYSFRHALIRDAAYEALLRKRRREIHRAIGEVIETRFATELPQYYDLLAHHYQHAQIWPKAFDYYCLAGHAQASKHALDEAIQLYDNAIAIGQLPDCGVDAEQLVNALEAVANLLFAQGRFGDSLRRGEEMADAARRSKDARGEAVAFVNMASAAMWAEDFERATRLATEAAELGVKHGHPGPIAGGTMIAGIIHALTGQLDQSETVLQRSIRTSREAGDHSFLAPALCFSSYRRNWMGCFDTAISLADEGERIANEQAQVAWSIRCKWTRGAALVATGAYDDALAVLRQGLALAEKIGDSAYVPRYINTLGWLYNECHAFELGADFNRRAVELDEETTHATGVERTMFALLNWADALLRQGDIDQAGDLLHRAYGIVGNPRTHEWMKWRYTTHAFASLAEYWMARRNPKKAAHFAQRCLEVASAKGSRKYLAMANRLTGVLAMERGDREAAHCALGAAEKLARDIGHPSELWKVHAALGELYERAGDKRTSASRWSDAGRILSGIQAGLLDADLRARFGRAASAATVFERYREQDPTIG